MAIKDYSIYRCMIQFSGSSFKAFDILAYFTVCNSDYVGPTTLILTSYYPVQAIKFTLYFDVLIIGCRCRLLCTMLREGEQQVYQYCNAVYR